MKKFNSNTAIIASYQEMIENDLLKVDKRLLKLTQQPNPDQTVLWVIANCKWTPIVDCYREAQVDSTHILGGYYFHFSAIFKSIKFEFLDYCEERAHEKAITIK